MIDPTKLDELLASLSPDERRELDRYVELAGPVSHVPDVQYERDPIGWARDVLGIPEHTIRWSLLPEYQGHTWDGTPDPLARIVEEIAAGRDVGVESGTGTGKTFLGGWIVLWFLACFENAIVVTTAPKEDQLTLHLWKELGEHFGRFLARYPEARMQSLRVRLKPEAENREKWAIVGYACGVDAETSAKGSQGVASRAKGFHAEHMLIVTEETQGIPPPIMTAFENTSTGSHNLRLAFGNPEHQFDALHQFCTSAGVTPIRVSALDHPNVVTGREIIPGAVTQKSIDRRRAKYGETSPLFSAQVRGISPTQASEALIRLEWLERAAQRYEAMKAAGIRGDRSDWTEGGNALGVDVANSEAGDKAAIARFRGACLEQVDAFPCPNANELGRTVMNRAGLAQVSAEHVGIDSVGVGAGTVNTCRDSKFFVQALNGGAAAIEGVAKSQGTDAEWRPDATLFNNLRSQCGGRCGRTCRRGAS